MGCRRDIQNLSQQMIANSAYIYGKYFNIILSNCIFSRSKYNQDNSVILSKEFFLKSFCKYVKENQKELIERIGLFKKKIWKKVNPKNQKLGKSYPKWVNEYRILEEMLKLHI